MSVVIIAIIIEEMALFPPAFIILRVTFPPKDMDDLLDISEKAPVGEIILFKFILSFSVIVCAFLDFLYGCLHTFKLLFACSWHLSTLLSNF